MITTLKHCFQMHLVEQIDVVLDDDDSGKIEETALSNISKTFHDIYRADLNFYTYSD